MPPQTAHPPGKLDLILTRAASLSQPLVLILAVFGYFYTVVPVYQKEVLSEQIAAKELELAKLQHKIDSTGPTMTRLQLEASKLQSQIRDLTAQSQHVVAINNALKDKQLTLAKLNSSLSSEVASKSATAMSAEEAGRAVAIRAYHDSFSASVSLRYVMGAVNAHTLVSTPSRKAIENYLLTPYDAISVTLAAGDSQFMPSNSRIPREVKDAYHLHLRAIIEARKDSLSRRLDDVNALLFQINSEMASTAIDTTPADNFNERQYETVSRLVKILNASRSREMARTSDVMESLELDSLMRGGK